jgi:hypothetical protein
MKCIKKSEKRETSIRGLRWWKFNTDNRYGILKMGKREKPSVARKQKVLPGFNIAAQSFSLWVIV